MTNYVSSQSINRRQLLRGMAAMGASGALATAGASTAASAASLAQDPVLISISTPGNDLEFQMFDTIIDGFEASQDGIRVDRQYDPALEWEKVINLLRTDTASDVQRVNDDSVYLLSAVGVIATLDEYFDRDLNREDYYDIMFQERVGPGGVLASAYVTSAPLIAFFNLDLFEEAGITPPSSWIDNNTDMAGWEEMFAKLLKKSGDRVEVYPFFGPYWQVETAMWNAGVDFWNEDESASTIDTPTAVEVLTRWQSWFEKDYFVPEGEDADQLFNSGLLAINLRYADFAYQVNEGIRFDIGPTWKGERTRAFHAGRNFTIPTASENKDAAWELVKWLWTEGQTEMARIDWGVPMRKEVAEGPVFLDPEKPAENHDILAGAMEIGSIPWPNNPASESFQVPFRRLSAVDTGQQSPEEFLSEGDAYLTGILEAVDWDDSKDTPEFVGAMGDEEFEEAILPGD